MVEKEQINKGAALHLLPTKKFKTTTILLQMLAPLEAETATERSLLSQVLKSATADYPSRKSIRSRLDYLYGAVFTTDVAKKGDYHLLTFRLDIANERYIEHAEPLLEEGLAFLKGAVLSPYLENGLFSGKIIAEEKRNLQQRMEAVYDDKIRYANNRMLQHMFPEDPYRLQAQGELERLEAISAERLMSIYESMLKEDKVDMYIIGDVEEAQAAKAASAFSVFEENHHVKKAAETNYSVRETPNHIKETDDIQQGKLHIGCRVPVYFKDSSFAAMQVANALLGGFPHSKLFLNVREKESLAYYAASRYDSLKGFVTIMAGIETSQYDKALAIITEQIEDMKIGRFTEDEVEQTKGMLVNQLLETADSAKGTADLLYQGIVGGRRISMDEWISQVQAVTLEEVADCAADIVIDTVFFLHGEKEDQ